MSSNKSTITVSLILEETLMIKRSKERHSSDVASLLPMSEIIPDPLASYRMVKSRFSSFDRYRRGACARHFFPLLGVVRFEDRRRKLSLQHNVTGDRRYIDLETCRWVLTYPYPPIFVPGTSFQACPTPTQTSVSPTDSLLPSDMERH